MRHIEGIVSYFSFFSVRELAECSEWNTTIIVRTAGTTNYLLTFNSRGMIAIFAGGLLVITIPTSLPSLTEIKQPPCQPASIGTEGSMSHSVGSSLFERRSAGRGSLGVCGSAMSMADSSSCGVRRRSFDQADSGESGSPSTGYSARSLITCDLSLRIVNSRPLTSNIVSSAHLWRG